MMPMLEAIIGFLNPCQITSLNFTPSEQPLISCGLFRLITSIHENVKGLFKV